jgi:hypothetical protein
MSYLDAPGMDQGRAQKSQECLIAGEGRATGHAGPKDNYLSSLGNTNMVELPVATR